MKKNILLITIILLLLTILLACSIGPLTIDLGLGGDSDISADGESGDGSVGGVEVGITSPAQGAIFPMGPVEIAYYATSVDGIASVELSVNGEVLSTNTNPDPSQQVVALKYSWDPAASGSHTIRVRALDANGNWSNYAVSTVTVESSSPAQQDDQPTQPAQLDPTDTPAATATPEFMTVYNVTHNQDIFYWGGGACGSKEITIEADITHPEDAYAGMIFFRFWDKEGGGLSSWSSAYPMARDSDEHFRITISSENIANYNKFEFAVMYYQIKIQSKPPNAVVLAGTDVIKQVELHRCP
jgi:hypothetical protein